MFRQASLSLGEGRVRPFPPGIPLLGRGQGEAMIFSYEMQSY